MKKIVMPDGKAQTFYRSEGQTWADVIQNTILPTWEAYCNEHWIDPNNHEAIWSFEKRTKGFLDRIAWLMIQDDPVGDVETKYKEVRREATQIPVSECPSYVGDYLYSTKIAPADDEQDDGRFEVLTENLDQRARRKSGAKKRRKETRFDRIEKIAKQNPRAKRTWCMVAADNSFVYKDKTYYVPAGASGYDTGGGCEAMDRVLVVDDGVMHLYDQSVFPIAM